MKRIKVLGSTAALARFLPGCRSAGYIPRAWRADIPSPYAYSPVTSVYAWQGRRVFWSEVRHGRYEVFELPAEMQVFRRAREAEAVNAL